MILSRALDNRAGQGGNALLFGLDEPVQFVDLFSQRNEIRPYLGMIFWQGDLQSSQVLF
jgi:hypothetical protein